MQHIPYPPINKLNAMEYTQFYYKYKCSPYRIVQKMTCPKTLSDNSIQHSYYDYYIKLVNKANRMIDRLNKTGNKKLIDRLTKLLNENYHVFNNCNNFQEVKTSISLLIIPATATSEADYTT